MSIAWRAILVAGLAAGEEATLASLTGLFQREPDRAAALVASARDTHEISVFFAAKARGNAVKWAGCDRRKGLGLQSVPRCVEIKSTRRCLRGRVNLNLFHSFLFPIRSTPRYHGARRRARKPQWVGV